MRIVSWNILHGGGKRTREIIDQLGQWEPDIVGLIEFKANESSERVAEGLATIGLSHQVQTIDEESDFSDGLFVASRWQLETGESQVLPQLGRWLHVDVLSPAPVSLALMWVPNRASSGIKYQFHGDVVATLASGKLDFAMGDTNTGMKGVDEEAPFFNKREDQWFRDLEDAGWHDVWRVRNPEAREHTWHSTNGGAGFRLDQFFANSESIQLVQSIRHDWGSPSTGKLRGPSDHAAMIVDVETS